MESIKSARPYNRIIKNPNPQQTKLILTKTEPKHLTTQRSSTPPTRATIPQIITHANTHPIIPQHITKLTTMSIINIKIQNKNRRTIETNNKSNIINKSIRDI